ncbi:MAG: hypothetical protein QGD94_12855, partial [Planctomycetia bacterium]|nr:hypothetical protein [Planctomycetia bacterium]
RSERTIKGVEGAIGKPRVKVRTAVVSVPMETLAGERTERAIFREVESPVRTERLASATGAESTAVAVVDISESLLVIQTGKKSVAAKPSERFGERDVATLKATGGVQEAQEVAFTHTPVVGAPREITAGHVSIVKGDELAEPAAAPTAVAQGATIEAAPGKSLDAVGVELVAAKMSMTPTKRVPDETKGGGDAERETPALGPLTRADPGPMTEIATPTGARAPTATSGRVARASPLAKTEVGPVADVGPQRIVDVVPLATASVEKSAEPLLVGAAGPKALKPARRAVKGAVAETPTAAKLVEVVKAATGAKAVAESVAIRRPVIGAKIAAAATPGPARREIVTAAREPTRGPVVEGAV